MHPYLILCSFGRHKLLLSAAIAVIGGMCYQ